METSRLTEILNSIPNINDAKELKDYLKSLEDIVGVLQKEMESLDNNVTDLNELLVDFYEDIEYDEVLVDELLENTNTINYEDELINHIKTYGTYVELDVSELVERIYREDFKISNVNINTITYIAKKAISVLENDRDYRDSKRHVDILSPYMNFKIYASGDINQVLADLLEIISNIISHQEEKRLHGQQGKRQYRSKAQKVGGALVKTR